MSDVTTLDYKWVGEEQEPVLAVQARYVMVQPLGLDVNRVDKKYLP